jgi:hypothetical protein
MVKSNYNISKKNELGKSSLLYGGAYIFDSLIRFSMTTVYKILVYITFIFSLIVYYYTSKFTRYVNNHPNCVNCISNKFYCNTILRKMIIYFVIYNVMLYVFKLTLKNTNYNLYSNCLFILSIIINILLIWFVYCLYHNLKDIDEKKCPCMDKYKHTVNNLKLVSIFAYYIMIIAVLLFIAMIIYIVFLFFNKPKY